MRHLIVYTHPNPASFNFAVRGTVASVLKQKNQDVRIRDLYALRFDPVLRGAELEGLQQGTVPRDVAIEQEHIRWADALIFIYPIWWTGMPALTRGYIDRVFSKGFAYDYDAEGLKGLLRGKKVQIINTMGAPLAAYETSGIFKSIEQLTDQETFRVCGMEVIGHHYFGSVPTVTQEERMTMLEEVARIAASLCT